MRRDPAIHDINKTNKESKLEPSETPAVFLGADDELSSVQACKVQIRLSNPSTETTRHTQFFLPNRGVVLTAAHSKYAIPCNINPTGDAVFRFSELYRHTATRTRRIRRREELHLKSVAYLRKCLRTLDSLRVKILKGSTDAITSISLEDHPLFRLIDLQRDQNPIGSERETGEICLRGYLVMKEYWDNKEGTKQTIDSNGWLHTGDLGILDHDMYLKIVGWKKDVIIRGGENVFPSEVEAFYNTHPDIDELHVIGLPDDYYGEIVCAWIKLKPGSSPVTATDLKKFGEGKIAHFKIPSIVRVVDSFPLTVSGKMMKFVMREEESNRRS